MDSEIEASHLTGELTMQEKRILLNFNTLFEANKKLKRLHLYRQDSKFQEIDNLLQYVYFGKASETVEPYLNI